MVTFGLQLFIFLRDFLCNGLFLSRSASVFYFLFQSCSFHDTVHVPAAGQTEKFMILPAAVGNGGDTAPLRPATSECLRGGMCDVTEHV